MIALPAIIATACNFIARALTPALNDHKPFWVIDQVKAAVADCLAATDKRASELKIACFGLAFKPNIDDLRESPAMEVREQIIFPEIDYDKVDRVRGLDITITTTAKSDEEGRALLAAFDFPFRK